MLRNRTWRAADRLTHAQLALFHSMADRVGLTNDDRRRVLNLDDRTWMAWTNFLVDGGIPADPPLPEMLRRLGQTTFSLSVEAETIMF